jgi:hypothetical protein
VRLCILKLNQSINQLLIRTHQSSDFGLLAFIHVHVFNPVFILGVTGSLQAPHAKSLYVPAHQDEDSSK